MDSKFSDIKAVLIDVDGTVLGSNDAHARSWVAALGAQGFSVPYDQVRSLIGKGGDKLLAETVGLDEDSSLGKQVTDSRQKLFDDHFLDTLKATAGARELLAWLRERKIRVVVATSAGGDQVHALLKRAGVDDLVDAVATTEDAEASKPDPDIVRAALQKAGVEAHEAVMIGDTPFDVEAASKAGIRSIALRCGGWWKDEDMAGAAAIYDDPRAMLDAWSGRVN